MTNRFFATLGLLSLLTAASLDAQNDPVQIQIPFAFRVGAKLLPAGHYSVSEGSQPFVSTIRSLDTGMTIVALTNGVYAQKRRTDPSLEFTRYGDAYFLKTIWSRGDSLGRQLHKSSVEREMARQVSLAKPAMVALKTH